MARWKYNVNSDSIYESCWIRLLWGSELQVSARQSVDNSEGSTLTAQSQLSVAQPCLLGPPAPDGKVIWSPLDLILACLQRTQQGANCKDGSGFQICPLRNWTYSLISFHAATRDIRWQHLWPSWSRSGPWCPMAPCYSLAIFPIPEWEWMFTKEQKSFS